MAKRPSFSLRDLGAQLGHSKLIRNASWLMVGNVLAKPIWFLFITAGCMRYLGPSGYGVLTTTMALSLVFTPFSDLGTSLYTTREAARSEVDVSALFTNLLVARVGLSILMVAGVMAVGLLLGYSIPMLHALFYAALFAAGKQMMLYCRAFYRSFEVMKHEAVSVLIDRICVVAGGGIALLYTPTPVGVLAGMALGMALALLINLLWVHVRFAQFQWATLSRAFTRGTFRLAAPLALLMVLTLLQGFSAPVFVELFLGEVTAGHFGAAARVLEALGAVALVLAGSALPRFAALQESHTDTGVIRRLVKRVLGVSLAIGIGIALVISVASPYLFQALEPSGGFADAAPLLRLLIWSFPSVMVTALLSSVLIALRQQRAVVSTYGVMVVLSVLAYVLLTERLGAGGVVAIQVVSEFAIAVVLAYSCFSVTRPPAATPVLLAESDS